VGVEQWSEVMVETTMGNWLGLAGAAYLFLAFAFIGGAALCATPGGSSVDAQRHRVMLMLAGGIGMMGVLLQAIGQAMPVPLDGVIAALVLALIPVMLLLVVWNDLGVRLIEDRLATLPRDDGLGAPREPARLAPPLVRAQAAE
jgi:hypothetical protein